MSRTDLSLRIAGALALLSALLLPLAVSAHETITAGNYAIEYGWLNEPAVVGQPNALVINLGAAEMASTNTGKITIAAPADGGKITGDKTEVSVKIEGIDAQTEGVHWHLYVDDQVFAMLPLDQLTVTVTGLTNGSHTVKAALADADHGDMGEPATVTLAVEGAADTGVAAVEGVATLEDDHTHESTLEVDISKLKLEVVYGGETKILTLQPLGEDTPGQFIAPLTPTRAGKYTVRLSGQLNSEALGQTEVNAEVQPEEIQTADIVQFPRLEAPTQSTPFGLAGWLGVIGTVAGLAGLALGVMSLIRKK